jgi:anti-sigma-K factor RskA
MKHERATEELREIAALYALGALTQQEARSFEMHMREECPVCEAEFLQFQRVIAGIGFAAEEAEAPDYLRDLLLARIEREKQPSAPAGAAPQAVGTEPQAPRPLPPPPSRLFQFQQPQPRPRFQAFFLAAMATALCLAALIAWRSARESENQLRKTLSSALAEAENLRILLDVQQEKTGQLEQILTMAGRPGVRLARLAGQGAAPEASAAILWDSQQMRCLVFGHFPPEPEGKVYQVWYLTPAAKIPGGILKRNPTGRVFAATPIAPNAAGATAVAVTAEAGSGSQTPTMPYYAAGRIE